MDTLLFKLPARLVFCAVVLLIALFSTSASAQEYDTELLQIISKLQVMAQGTYTEKEWGEVTSQLDRILETTAANGQWNRYVETQVIRAKALSMRGNDKQALDLMQSTLKEFADKEVPAVKKVYVEIASIHARQGNEQAVAEIMRDFKASSHYDGETYSFTGGTSPQDPLLVPRPKASPDTESISMTAMQVYRTQAHYAAGQPFPSFTATDWEGREISLERFQGKVVLVDFWASGWFVWKRDLAYRKSIYENHRAAGFEILGMNIEPDQTAAQAFASAQNMSWPQAVPPRDLKKTLGIFGETTNFLLDRQGMIIGRDLYGGDLEAAVRAALKK